MNPFTVEFGDGTNSTIVVKVLRQQVRGHFALGKLSRGHNVGTAMAGMPDIPGLQMRVDPRKREVVFHDVLADDKKLREQINAVFNNPQAGPIRTDRKIEQSRLHGVKQTLDPDRFKTLLIQTVELIKEGMAKIVNGQPPTAKELAEMNGKELYDVMNSSATKPKYREDVADWEQKLAAAEA